MYKLVHVFHQWVLCVYTYLTIARMEVMTYMIIIRGYCLGTGHGSNTNYSFSKMGGLCQQRSPFQCLKWLGKGIHTCF